MPLFLGKQCYNKPVNGGKIMNLSLSTNIAKLRREHSMTQEQLAEALGVTFASVSKWERGVATPELGLIARMADIFGVSLDALVGYEVIDRSAEALEKQILDLQRSKQYDEAIARAEKALLRYPNDFRIVRQTGELYAVSGIETENKKHLRRCIELLERSVLLLSQNSDPEISEVSIKNEVAQCYIVLGDTEKGVDILKKYNVSGINNALIAIALTGNDITYTATPEFDLDNALSYMVGALASFMTDSLRTMLAYANYFKKKGDYAAARESLVWLTDMLESLKIDKSKSCYLDKAVAPCYAECAHLSLVLGESEKINMYMQKAYNSAKLYDSAPITSLDNIKFCIGDSDNTVTYDDLGLTANEAVVKQITKAGKDTRLYEIWQVLALNDKEVL